MNKNKENYKKAIDQIHVDSSIKENVVQKINLKNNTNKVTHYLRYIASFAAILIVAVVGIVNLNQKNNLLKNETIIDEDDNIDNNMELLSKVNIKRFKSNEELREVLKDSEKAVVKGIYYDDVMTVTESAKSEEAVNSSESNYSKTNNQVENVDEADIVKTDGKYIYYLQNNYIYIIDSELNMKAKIKDDNYRPTQIFINDEKLIVFGDLWNTNNIFIDSEEMKEDSSISENVSVIYRPKTSVRVYDLKNIENPKLLREISVDGNYQEARMIENTVYFITNYTISFYQELDKMSDLDLLPSYKDSVITSKTNYIKATDIAYFDDSNNYGYSIIAGFCLDSNDKVNIETFFGAGENIYVSENNMYIVSTNYRNYWEVKDSTIYKFKLKNSSIYAMSSCNVKGYVNNQFSIDEYKGNLRIATTSYKSNWNYEDKYETHLTIFDENLKKIGEIKNLVKDEEIYSVRFIGDVGYIVTFEEIDPLWVIDLSDPTNPIVKGALEIPGYSSYLHPYDETHIIGIGYNVKDNGYGGIANDTMKLSMFDVSDLENPKEIFNISMDKKAYSSISYDHKALFFNKDENLIGFPINIYNERINKNGLILYKIDLDNNKFQEISKLLENGSSSIQRAIYIEDNIYILSVNKIEKYDLNSLRKIKELEIEYDYLYR